MAKYGLIRGHGYGDPGAQGNGTNERDFLTPVVQKISEYLNDDVVYELSHDAFQDRTVVDWAKSNGVTEVIELHLDSGGSVGHVIVNGRYAADELDKRCERVVAMHFGSKGIIGRTDLYNLNVCGDAGISYRLIEVCPVTDTEDITYFNNHIDEVARDFAAAISGTEVVPVTVQQHDQTFGRVDLKETDKTVVRFRGWGFNTRLQPNNKTDLVAEAYTLFLMDLQTGTELARKSFHPSYRDDVSNAFPQYKNVGYGAFDVTFDIDVSWHNKFVFPMLRFSGLDINQPKVDDIYFRNDNIQI